ncbi:hypothetical protein BTVI_84140 [Pitangus sulphuratus]|nr:hypothetical protein BTVI_84140 [Pitangus sulphuratus]
MKVQMKVSLHSKDIEDERAERELNSVFTLEGVSKDRDTSLGRLVLVLDNVMVKTFAVALHKSKLAPRLEGVKDENLTTEQVQHVALNLPSYRGQLISFELYKRQSYFAFPWIMVSLSINAQGQSIQHSCASASPEPTGTVAIDNPSYINLLRGGTGEPHTAESTLVLLKGCKMCNYEQSTVSTWTVQIIENVSSLFPGHPKAGFVLNLEVPVDFRFLEAHVWYEEMIEIEMPPGDTEVTFPLVWSPAFTTGDASFDSEIVLTSV